MKNKLIELLPRPLYLQLRWYDFRLNRKKTYKKIQKLRTTDSSEKGGYLPFDKAKAIFVHIPKCAGISINKALFNSIGGGHTTLDQYLNVFPPSEFNQYFKFTIVRNPWDRVVSAYSFLKQGGLNDWDRNFYDKEISKYGSFKDFIEGWLTPDNIMKFHHFRPQKHYILDKYQKVSVDFIGYLELIDEDFKYIANKLNISAELKKQNTAKRDDYRAYYDADTRAIVAKIYADDIALLNYDFEGVITPIRSIK